MKKKLISISDAAKKLGVSNQTVLNWGKSGTVKVHANGKRGKSYWVDADTIDAISDTVADVEHARKMFKEEHRRLCEQYKEEHELIDDIRRELSLIRRYGKNISSIEFYLSIPVMLCDLEIINEKEKMIMCHIIRGDKIEKVMDKYGLTRERIRQIFFKGCRKARQIEDIKKKLDNAEDNLLELEYLRKKERACEDYIRELEAKLEIKRLPQEEQDRKLMMKRLVSCNLSVRALNCLKAADIETVGDLLQVNKTSLLNFRNFGKKTLRELDDFLKSIGKDWGTKYLIPIFSKNDRWNRPIGYRLSDKPE